MAAGRAILGERQFARARAEENLRETLATFYEACSSIDGDKQTPQESTAISSYPVATAIQPP